jgi:hypothetical protein
MNSHPIQPPTELIEKIVHEAIDKFPDDDEFPIKAEEAREEYLATYFAQWGADQELDACCEWIDNETIESDSGLFLRATRRPKSVKQQALEIITNNINSSEWSDVTFTEGEVAIIRRAVEESK